MKRPVTLLIAHLLVAAAVAQPSLEETEQWITEKLSESGYAADGVSHRYTISFGGQDGIMAHTMIVRNDSWAPVIGQEKCIATIDLLEISYISFTPRENVIWLNIALKSNHENSSETCVYLDDGIYSFILRKSFAEDDLPNRIKKAFSRLVELNGGKALGTGEPY